MRSSLPAEAHARLQAAMSNDDAETLGVMLDTKEGGLSLSYQDSGIPSLMILAISRGAVRCVERLIAAGASVSERIWCAGGEEHQDRTALNFAVSTRKFEAAELLLAAGANPRLPDVRGNTALHALVGCGLPSDMRRLGTEAERLVEIARKLVEAGCPINQVDGDGLTPLAFAVEIGAPLSLIETLLALAADPNIADAKGRQTLHLATTERHIPVMRLLANNGADLNGRNRDGLTPLHCAEDLAAMQELIDLGADVGGVNHEGRDAFHCILAHLGRVQNAQEMLVCLLAHGADPRRPDYSEETALELLEKWYPADSEVGSAVRVAITAADARKAMRNTAARRSHGVRP